MATSERTESFEKIRLAYETLELDWKTQRKPLVFDTKKGIFGAMTCERAFEFFTRICLARFKRFIDIGSGDGRIVLIASLFTNAEGIEIDEDLCATAKKIRKETGISAARAKIMCKDLFEHDFSAYDIIFINPDQGWHKGLEEKLLREMRDDAVLYVNNEIFLPQKFKKGPKIWVKDIPVIEYKKPVQDIDTLLTRTIEFAKRSGLNQDDVEKAVKRARKR